MSEEFGLGVETACTFEQAVLRTRVAMRSQGFGILSEMPAPPGVGEAAGRTHLFMGVWQGPVALSNLGGQGLDVGDHLPVNVVVYEEGDRTMVAVLDPIEGLAGWGEGAAVAEEVRAALGRLFEQVASPSPGG